MTVVYNPDTKQMEEVAWASLGDSAKRSLLPLQSAQVAVRKTETTGAVNYLTAALSAESGTYEVVMDYMKYRVEDAQGAGGTLLGHRRVGIGLRIKALVVTSSAGLNLASLGAIGLEASRNNLSGGISVDVIGIDSEAVTNLIPLTSEINQTSIQSALQALASVKSKMWEDDVTITPHLIATEQVQANSREQIRGQVSQFMSSRARDLLRGFWIPDGETVDASNEALLKGWMEGAGLTTGPGRVAMFLNAAEYEPLRKKAVEALIPGGNEP